MDKKHEKERKCFRNNTYSYERENNALGNRNEQFQILKSRPSLHQSYPFEKYNHLSNSTCPDIIPQGPRYPYTSLHYRGIKKNRYSPFFHNYAERYQYFPLHRACYPLDFKYFSRQPKDDNIHKLDKYERGSRNGYKIDFSSHRPHLAPHSTPIHKYNDQSFDSYMSIGSSKVNGATKNFLYCKNISKERNWNKRKEYFERNTTKNLSHFEYEKSNNYDLQTTSDSSIEMEKDSLLKTNITEKKDMYKYCNYACTSPFNSKNDYSNDDSKERDISSKHKSVDISFQNDTKSHTLFSPTFHNNATNDHNNEHNCDDCNTSFSPDMEESKSAIIGNEANIYKSVYEEIHPMDQNATDFKKDLLPISYTINDDSVFQDFAAQEDDEGLTQEDVYIKIQKIDNAILTCENRLHEIQNKKLDTIKITSNDEKKTPITRFSNSLSSNDFLNFETNLSLKIYSENKKKAKQNCIKFPYLKICNNSLNDYPFYKENELKHKRLRPLLFLYISQKNKRIFEKNRILQLQYEKYRRSWESQVERLENIKKIKKQENERSSSLDSHVDNLSLRSFRRGQGLNYGDFVRSDADFEDIIAKLGAEDDRISRAAIIPPMISDIKENIRYQYIDKNRLIDDPISFFHYPTSLDIWTAEEHELFKQLFIKYPQKNFAQIASNIPNKTISQCILHYYLTKKQENYKSLIISKNSDRAKRRGRGRSSKKMEKAKASSLLADLQPNVINDDIDDYEKE